MRYPVGSYKDMKTGNREMPLISRPPLLEMLLKDEINPKKRRTDEIENFLKNAREQLERCDLSTKRSIANQMVTYINMAKETFHDSMKTVEDDIERAIILMQEETLDAMDKTLLPYLPH